MKKKTQKDTAINTRYPEELLVALRQFAQEDERSLNGEIIWILRDYVMQRQRKGHGISRSAREKPIERQVNHHEKE